MTTNQLDCSQAQPCEQHGTCDPALQLEFVLEASVAICSEATMRKTVGLFDLGKAPRARVRPSVDPPSKLLRAPPDNTLPRDTVCHTSDDLASPMTSAAV